MTSPDQLQELSTVWVGAGHLAAAKAAIVLVLPEPEAERSSGRRSDLGQATMSMILARRIWVSAVVILPSGTRKSVDVSWRVPPDRTCAYMIASGYPADRPLRPIVKPDRRPFDEVVHTLTGDETLSAYSADIAAPGELASVGGRGADVAPC